MKLEEVLPALRKGKKIRRAIWNNSDDPYDSYIHYNKQRECFRMAHLPDITCLYAPDFLADDWEVVE